MPRIGSMRYPNEARLWADEFELVAPFSMLRQNASSQSYDLRAPYGLEGVGQHGSRYFTIDGGVYKFWVLGIKGLYFGIISWYIDGVEVVSGQDWYHSSLSQYNQVQTAVVTVSAGRHLLRWEITGKNPLSNAYGLELTKVWFSLENEG